MIFKHLCYCLYKASLFVSLWFEICYILLSLPLFCKCVKNGHLCWAERCEKWANLHKRVLFKIVQQAQNKNKRKARNRKPRLIGTTETGPFKLVQSHLVLDCTSVQSSPVQKILEPKWSVRSKNILRPDCEPPYLCHRLFYISYPPFLSLTYILVSNPAFCIHVFWFFLL